MFEKLGLEAQFLHVGKYKSAPETLTRDGMSEPARESLDAYIETLWQTMAADLREAAVGVRDAAFVELLDGNIESNVSCFKFICDGLKSGQSFLKGFLCHVGPPAEVWV